MIVYLLRKGEDDYFAWLDMPVFETDISKGIPNFTKRWATAAAQFKRRETAREYMQAFAREGDPEWKIIRYDMDKHCRTEVEP